MLYNTNCIQEEQTQIYEIKCLNIKIKEESKIELMV